MITPIKSLNIWELMKRENDLLVSVDDVKAIAKNEREKILCCLPKCHDENYQCELSKDDCFECMYETLDKIERKLKEQNNE